MCESFLRVGLVTVSDRASGGVYEDQGGPALRDWFEHALATPWEMVQRVIPDERVEIERTLRELCDVEGCALVVTTGGTGPAPRDVTPDATEAVCERMLPGFGERMRQISLKYVPTAILSRQIAGIRGTSLLVNLPGRPSSISETLDELFVSIPYCIELMGGPYIETHPEVVAAFRPKSK
jgi:molybdopterin adenylyltransferase